MVAVPIVDLTKSRRGERDEIALAAIDGACRDHGFFLIVGHGLEEKARQVLASAQGFFALPRPEKHAIMRDRAGPMGYYDRELTKNKRDLKEVFDFTDDGLGAVDPTLKNRWPTGQGAFRHVLTDYLDSCAASSGMVLQLVIDALAYGGDERAGEARSVSEFFTGPQTSFLRLNHYPAADLLEEEEQAEVTPLGDMALHHHTDAGALTLLLQDGVGGLQCFAESEWIDVEPVPDSLVINIGDLVQVWSNDTYISALHRVRPITAGERFSAPYFYNPRFEAVIEPLPASSAPVYRPFLWEDFRKGRAEGDFADYGAEIQIADFRVSAAR